MTTISLREHWNGSQVPRPSLAHGIRAAAVAGSAAYPFRSMRRMLGSFRPSKDFSYLGSYPDQVAVPRGRNGDLDAEVQGIVYDDEYLYLVTTDSIYALERFPGVSLKSIPEAELFQIDNDGFHHIGRRQLNATINAFGSEPTYGPKHLSSPTLYRGYLLVPAEGNPSNPEDQFPASSMDTRPVPGRYQWIWVFDRASLGFVGRIGLDAWESGLGTGLAWISADDESGLLYASTWGGVNPGEVVADVKVFRLPALDRLAGIAPATVAAIGVQHLAPPLSCPFVGSLPLLDGDGRPPRIRKVNGGVITPVGHLFLNFMTSDKTRPNETAFGVLELDLLSGRVTAFLSLESLNEGFQQLQGMATIDNRLFVLVWDQDLASASDYDIHHFSTSDGSAL